MKKILLGTTGLVGAALFAAAASAETPKVTLGGFSDFQAGWSDNDSGSADLENVDDSDLAFRNDNEVSVHIDGKTDGGLAYGAVVDLEADISGDNDTDHTSADSTSSATRTFTYLEGGWGRVELGGNKSAAATMRVDASTIAVATGGINGAWRHFVNPTGSTANPGGVANTYITTSKLQSEHGGVDFMGDETTYNITKATYYTPRFSGFQAGISYTPDMDDSGQIAQRVEDTYSDVVDLGIGYEGQFSGVKFAASATGEWADSEVAATDDIEGWNLGAVVGWNAFSVAASYGEWDEGAFTVTAPVAPATVTNLAEVDGEYWTLGAAYDAGAIGLSATYLSSELEVGAGTGDNEFDNFVIGADYKLAPGLTTYAEVAFYEFDDVDADEDNDGTTFLIGTQVAY